MNVTSINDALKDLMHVCPTSLDALEDLMPIYPFVAGAKGRGRGFGGSIGRWRRGSQRGFGANAGLKVVAGVAGKKRRKEVNAVTFWSFYEQNYKT